MFSGILLIHSNDLYVAMHTGSSSLSKFGSSGSLNKFDIVISNMHLCFIVRPLTNYQLQLHMESFRSWWASSHYGGSYLWELISWDPIGPSINFKIFVMREVISWTLYYRIPQIIENIHIDGGYVGYMVCRYSWVNLSVQLLIYSVNYSQNILNSCVHIIYLMMVMVLALSCFWNIKS